MGNRLLAALPRAELQSLLPKLETICLEGRQVLYEPGKPIRFVYFPKRSVISMLPTLDESSTIELARVGNEGMAGLCVFHGASTTPFRFLVQVPGEALRLRAEDLKEEANRRGPLYSLLSRYTNAYISQLAQLVACNGRHTVKQRFCRWLLMTQDSAESDKLPLTQESIAQLLGVRRASVADVARKLQRSNVIRSARGTIEILDRKGLETSTCECYGIIQGEINRVFSK